MTALDAFVDRRRRGADLLDALAVRVADTGDATHAEQLRRVASRARDGRFVVLLLGCFSSGKSTLLNALLGRRVLPVKVNPCTAILTEVTHGDSPSVELRHRDGTIEPLTVDAFTEAYQLRTASTDEAGAEATDRFGAIDRAVVRWPLPLLGNGVVLLDTPGLDDDEIRTARTLASLPDADAVIVVLSATRFLTDLERRTVRRDLLPLGLTNLFFPVTMVDLLDAVSDDPQGDLENLQLRGRDVLGPLCTHDGGDRFEERFFPLDARGALYARYDRDTDGPRTPPDAAALGRSGVPAFERALERFLVDERGSAQLRHLHGTARRVRDVMARRAEIDRATASASLDELRQRHTDLEPNFDALRAIAGRVGRTVDRFVSRQQKLIWQDLRDFMAETEDLLPDALDRFDLGTVAGLDLLTPRGRDRVEQKLRSELASWLEERVADWQRSLRPTIELALQDLRTELLADATDFEDLAARIVTDFAGQGFALPTPDGEPPVAPTERWFSVAAGAILLSPGAMAAGWSEGYEGMLKGLASRIGVRLAILTLGALIGPIGWAGVALYVVSDAVLLVLTGGGQLRRLRSEVSQQLRGHLVGQVDSARDEVEARVHEGLSPLRDALVQAAQTEADELQALLERTVQERATAVRDAAEREVGWEQVLSSFDKALSELAVT